MRIRAIGAPLAFAVVTGFAAGAAEPKAAPSAPADTTYTITFDAGDPVGGLAAGTVLSNQYAAATGATFTPNAAVGTPPTGTWASNTDMTIVSSTGADVGGLGAPSLVSGNILRSFNGWLGENGDASFLVTFSQPMKSFSATFAGISTTTSTKLVALDASDTPIQTVAAPSTGQVTLTVSQATAVIAKVAVMPGDFNDWVGVDNISFTTPVELMRFSAD